MQVILTENDGTKKLFSKYSNVDHVMTAKANDKTQQVLLTEKNGIQHTISIPSGIFGGIEVFDRDLE